MTVDSRVEGFKFQFAVAVRVAILATRFLSLRFGFCDVARLYLRNASRSRRTPNCTYRPDEGAIRETQTHSRAARTGASIQRRCERLLPATILKPAEFGCLGTIGARGADSASNNLIEADDATSEADFLSKISIALREVKESRAALIKLRLGHLDHFQCTAEQELESEASQLAAIFATIILNMRLRLEQERANRKARKS